MKKLKRVGISLLVVVTMAVPSLGVGLKSEAYTIDSTYNAVRSTKAASPNYILLHETGGIAPARNNAIYFNREWRNVGAYTAYVVGDGGKVYQLSPDGLVQWGAGSYANANSPVQIELARTASKAQFKIDYAVYVNLTRDKAKKYNIPLTLDSPYNSRGIKTHLWVTQNIWGDHVDPYGYLASMGISKAQLAKDLQTGLPEDGSQTGSGSSVTPTPPATNTNYESTSGTYTFSTTTKIRNGVGLSGAYSGKNYNIGETVSYDRIYRSVDGYDWLSYTSYSGTRRYVAMINSSSTATPSAPQIKVDGYWGTATTKRVQQVLGTTADGIMGPNTIRAIQRKVGVSADGIMGPNTIRAMQSRFGTYRDGFISKPSTMVRAMQTRLNAGTF